MPKLCDNCFYKNSKMCRRKNSRLYAIHKEMMQKSCHYIDNNAPMLHIEMVNKSGKAMDDYRRLKEITRENRVLMNQMNVNYRYQGVIDPYNNYGGIRVTKLRKRIDELEEIDYQNAEMLLRLLKTKPEYKTKYFLDEWENKTLKYMRGAAKYNLNLRDLQPVREIFEEFPSTIQELGDDRFNKVYLKFEINLKPIGRVIIKLDNNNAPRCSSAFLEYLAYYDELRKNDCDDTCFNEDEQNPRVKWIYPNLYMRLESTFVTLPNDDIMNERETTISKENFKGILACTMSSDKKLHFIISFRNIPVISKHFTIIGHVITGFDTLKHIEFYGHRHTGRSTADILIKEWGHALRC